MSSVIDLSSKIAETASGPRSVKGDRGEVQSQPVSEQIAADRYLAGKSAVKKKNRGLRFSQLVPPGAV